MATIQRPVKTYGTRTYAGEVAAAPGNEDPILATEVDADLDTMYAAWNGGADTVNLKDGSVTEAKLAVDAHLWTISGTTIKPFDASKAVAIPGSATAASLLLGSLTGKARLQTSNQSGAPYLALTANRDTIANTQDDATKPSWQISLDSPNDGFFLSHWAAGGPQVNMLTVNNAGIVSVLGDATKAMVLLGNQTAKGRIQASNTTTPWCGISTNRDIAAGTVDDATKAAWQLHLHTTLDRLVVARIPAGGAYTEPLIFDQGSVLTIDGNTAGSFLQLKAFGSNFSGAYRCYHGRGTTSAPTPSLQWDSIGNYSGFGCYAAGQNFYEGSVLRMFAWENWTSAARGSIAYIYTTPLGSTTMSSTLIFDGAGNLNISGTVGMKASGTTWANPSDPRLKDDIAPYAAGLAEILQLDPITYRLKAQPDGPIHYGFDAAAVRDVFPECVSEMRMKLDPGDEEETDGVLTFDMHPILVALINAVKELAAKVEGHA